MINALAIIQEIKKLINGDYPSHAEKEDVDFCRSLIRLYKQSDNDNNFINNLKHLLSQRRSKIKGSAVSYCRDRDFWLNKICLDIARHIDPEHPQNVLMPDLYNLKDNQGRAFNTIGWYDFITTEQDDFFIYLPDFFDNIWNDVQNNNPQPFRYINKAGQPTHVTALELAMIEQLFPEASEFFKYAQDPDQTCLEKLKRAYTAILTNPRRLNTKNMLDNISIITTLPQSVEDLHSLLPDQQQALLIVCAQGGHISLLKLLMELPDINVNPTDNPSVSPLYFAVINGFSEGVELLLKHGADVDKMYGGATLLYLAALYGHKNSIKALLKHNAKVNIEGYDGRTALSCAAEKGHIDCMITLLEHNANVNQEDNIEETPLYKATQNKHLDCVQTLLKHGAKVNQARYDGITPLYFATANGDGFYVRVLINHDANVLQAENSGHTALHMAARKQDISTYEILLKAPYCSKHPDALTHYFDTTEFFKKPALIAKAKTLFITIATDHYTKPYLEQTSNRLEAYIACYRNLIAQHTQVAWIARHSLPHTAILKKIKNCILKELNENPEPLNDEQTRREVEEIMDHRREMLPGFFSTPSSRQLHQIIQSTQVTTPSCV